MKKHVITAGLICLPVAVLAWQGGIAAIGVTEPGLHEAASVDFAAQTVQKGSVRVFVNPAYEKKSLTWKAMYRAGKGPTAAGLEVARAWLKEL